LNRVSRIMARFDRFRARLAPPQRERQLVEQSPGPRFERVGTKAILFVLDLPSAGARYRCDHQAEQLGLLGASFDIVQSGQIDLATAVDHYECFVLNRVQWSEDVAAFLERARFRNKIVIFDTDDLIFEPELDRHFAYLEGWPEESRRREIEKFERYGKTLQACGRVMVSTEPLRAYACRRSDDVRVVFNSVSEEMVRLADEALAASGQTGSGGNVMTIAYLSGTRTHNRDFLEAADAVLWALGTYPQTRFFAVGKLDLDGRFDELGSRISRIPLRPWQALPELLAEVDINLAPLEPDNPVTECRSCVKYLEAGLLGVPTIASARTDFRRVIEHGRNGLLADTPLEWRDAFRQLIESPSMRQTLGARAREDVLRNHTTAVRASLLQDVLSGLAGVSDEDTRRLKVNVLFDRSGESMGSVLSDSLREAGHAVRTYVEVDELAPADVSIATDPVTAETVARHRHSLFKCHLVSAIAHDTDAYALPVRLIGLGSKLADRLSALTGRPTDQVATDRVGEELELILRRMCFVTMSEAEARACH
jgi:glycosyltransferase involved in cell wall biosynthesis